MVNGNIYNEKMRKNLKKVYNRIQKDSKASLFGKEEVLFLAIGGYNKTRELLIEMGLQDKDIYTTTEFKFGATLAKQTHHKKALIIKKINYVTGVVKSDVSFKRLDLSVADGFYEQMMVYKDASWLLSISNHKTEDWVKPTLVILDDQTLNLQYGGYRFNNNPRIGFTQVRDRNADPRDIIEEIKDVEEADYMMFALYQQNGADETDVINALNKLSIEASRIDEDQNWYFKPTEYKRICGSNELAQAMKEMDELGITQLNTNKRFGQENARWVIIPSSAFEFRGFEYKDEEEMFEEELAMEEESEEEYAERQEALLNEILDEPIHMNVKTGYIGRDMASGQETVRLFASNIDQLEDNVPLLESASTDDEYNAVKAHHLPYFLDGQYKDNQRDDSNYLGNKKLVSIDLDDGNYTREDIEGRLEEHGLFGIVYPTARYYYDGSLRWRVVMVADQSMDKEDYKQVAKGVSQLLDLEEADAASTKLSQLMGLPLKQEDVTFVIGSKINVKQYQTLKQTSARQEQNIAFFESSKSILDFNHQQAQKLKQAMQTGIPEGERNETYYQIYLFLSDTLEDSKYQPWHKEAQQYIGELDSLMARDGLSEKERRLIMREEA